MYTLNYNIVKDMSLTKINWFGSHDNRTYNIFNNGLDVDNKELGFANFTYNVGLGMQIARLGQMQS